MDITCALETGLTAEEYIECVSQSKLGETRPLGNPERVQAYLDNSNVTITARANDGTLLGIFRGMSDWHWVCYCADLAVAEPYQGQGIGKLLMQKAVEVLGPGIGITLFALPGAEGFYQAIGMEDAKGFFRDRSIST